MQTSRDNLACSSKTILKTLMVTLIGNFGRRRVRALIDDGAQSSYILKSLAEDMKLITVGQEEMVHILFGGVRSAPIQHNEYKIKLQDAAGNHSVQLTVMDKQKICEDLPRLPRGPWIKILKNHGIWLSDVGGGSPEIELLIGADMLPIILTNRPVVHLDDSIVAIETVLGWTVMGKPKQENSHKKQSTVYSVLDMFVSNASNEQLWDLESIGIRDPAANKTKQETDDSAKEHFLSTVRRLEDGRYSVSLPWINGRPNIPDNRKAVEKRLNSTTRKLKLQGNLHNYGQLFKSWEAEGNIEEVNENEINSPSHYLPHRAVLKPGSLTTPIRPVFHASYKDLRTPSLNECLEKGPNLLELIPSILLKFRMKKIGLIGDI